MTWFHRLLRIDLTRQRATVEEIPTGFIEGFVGGKGLGTYYLYREVDPRVDPLGPENKVFIAPGALNGTLTPAASRYEMVTKSPLTGLYLDCNAGGHFGPELKLTGHDLVVLEGRSSRPVALVIVGDEVQFRDASHLWGRPIYETETTLRAELGDPRFRIASIGPAGERLVKFACVGNDYSRQIARGGIGAVFGSKRVKAIAVRGTCTLPVADPEAFLTAVDKALKQIFANEWVPHKREHGTIGSLDDNHTLGIAPVYNFTRGVFEAIDRVDSTVFGELVEVRLACAVCPVACSKGLRWRGGGEGDGIEGPEYETASLLGLNCLVDDPQDIIRANLLCNQLGLDTISAGAVVGMILAAADKGLIAWGELGLAPHLSRGEMVASLLERIARREGIGDVLAEGARAAGEALGFPELAPHVKGMELPAYDPRVSPGMALAYMTSDRGACHLRTYPFGREVSGVLPWFSLEQKAEFVKRQQDEKAAQECLGVCQFPYGIGLLTDDLPNLLSTASGGDWSYQRLCLVGERIWNLSRAFDVLLGVDRQADYLPRRFAEEPMPDGMGAGHVVSRADQDWLLDRYYRLRGWDERGLPTPETWERLGLGEFAEWPHRRETGSAGWVRLG
ncbi:MAG: aldehyde ferredoxin oxidoreductase family protein [Anaerolineae bacterium]|nr:aldehyde ferredoxin oxidoreductase family protein [Anaerolineae bacterium]